MWVCSFNFTCDLHGLFPQPLIGASMIENNPMWFSSTDELCCKLAVVCAKSISSASWCYVGQVGSCWFHRVIIITIKGAWNREYKIHGCVRPLLGQCQWGFIKDFMVLNFTSSILLAWRGERKMEFQSMREKFHPIKLTCHSYLFLNLGNCAIKLDIIMGHPTRRTRPDDYELNF